MQKNGIKRAKEVLVDKIISQEVLRKKNKARQSIEDVFDEYEKELESFKKNRVRKGVKCIVKMKSNGTNHHNQSATDLGRPLKTLKAIAW